MNFSRFIFVEHLLILNWNTRLFFSFSSASIIDNQMYWTERVVFWFNQVFICLFFLYTHRFVHHRYMRLYLMMIQSFACSTMYDDFGQMDERNKDDEKRKISIDYCFVSNHFLLWFKEIRMKTFQTIMFIVISKKRRKRNSCRQNHSFMVDMLNKFIRKRRFVSNKHA